MTEDINRCDNCDGEIRKKSYYWKGYEGKYCNSYCAAEKCPTAQLETEDNNKYRGNN